MNDQKKDNGAAKIVTMAGVAIILSSMVLFFWSDFFPGLDIAGAITFALGVLLCIVSGKNIKKSPKKTTEEQEREELTPPRDFSTKIEDDSDRYVSKQKEQEDYRKTQEAYHHNDPHRQQERKDEHVVCPYCGFINSPGRKECILCHKELVKKCPECGEENAANALYCHRCGKEFAKKK